MTVVLISSTVWLDWFRALCHFFVSFNFSFYYPKEVKISWQSGKPELSNGSTKQKVLALLSVKKGRTFSSNTQQSVAKDFAQFKQIKKSNSPLKIAKKVLKHKM